MTRARIMSIHAARECACGAGSLLPLGRGGEARLVATREALVTVEVACEEDLDRAEIPGTRAAPVVCWSCGADAPATHIVICADGCPVGADRVEDLAEYGRREEARARALRAVLPPLSSTTIPDGIGEAPD